MIVVSRTPLRISFFGGGTDIPAFYARSHGAVLCTSIDKYLYVTLKPHGPVFREPYRISYSTTELAAGVDDINNDIVRETLKLLDLAPPLYISTVADLPAGSGLGSSSSFAVGLLNACYSFIGRHLSAARLADLACHVELDRLKKPIGRQDQYAAAMGGLNLMTFHADHKVSIKPLLLQDERIESLFSTFMLFWTGITRAAEGVLERQSEITSERMAALSRMRSIAEEAAQSLSEDSFSNEQFGEMLHESWMLKRRLVDGITSSQIDRWYQAAIQAGAWGGKICGAGGGGFLLVCAPVERHATIRAALRDLTEVRFGHDQTGTRILHPN